MRHQPTCIKGLRRVLTDFPVFRGAFPLGLAHSSQAFLTDRLARSKPFISCKFQHWKHIENHERWFEIMKFSQMYDVYVCMYYREMYIYTWIYIFIRAIVNDWLGNCMYNHHGDIYLLIFVEYWLFGGGVMRWGFKAVSTIIDRYADIHHDLPYNKSYYIGLDSAFTAYNMYIGPHKEVEESTLLLISLQLYHYYCCY